MFVGQSSFFLVIVSWMVFITMHAAIIPSNFTTMSSNQSVVFRCCSVFTVNETLVANCSNLNWTFVDLRCVPVTTEVLLLDRNNLTTLTNGSFQTLTSLLQLSIQSSNVHRIEIDTFLGLSLLQNLNLENNELSDMDSSFNPQTFRHLTNLSQLFIGNNQNISKSLGDAFIYLHNLSILSMDGSATLHVGSEFSHLTQLNNLTLNCSKVRSVTNESFVGLWSSKLTILNLIGFNKLTYDPDDFDRATSQKQFSDDAFQNLNSLEVLRIINCRIGNKNMARKIKHFINSSLHTLYLEATHYKRGFYTPNSTLEDGVLFKSTAKYLSQLTLTHVSWIDSNIFAIEPGVITSSRWRHNLRFADFSKNLMGWLGWRFPLLEASRLEKLEELTITAPSPESEVSYFYDGLDFYKRDFQPSSTTHSMNTYNTLDTKVKNSRYNAYNLTVSQMLPKVENNDSEKIKSLKNEVASALESIPLSPITSYAELDSISEQSLFELSDNPPYPVDSGTWTVRMSHSLRIIKIMYMLHGDNNVGNQSVQFIQTPREAANVTHFYFVGNSVFRGTGRLMGLTNLQLFDLSKNSLTVAPYFFDDFPSLRYLILQSMKNEDFFQLISIYRIIQNMPELRYLDLTDNKLNFLPPNLFSRNSHITHVILAKNRFSSFPITMDLVPNLKTLDLSGNAIIYLTEEETSSLTKHSENVRDFYLLLAENNIACVCSQIKFLLWLNISTFLDNKGAYSCTSQDGQLILTNVLWQDVLGFYRQCYGYNYFMISIVLLLVMSFIFLMAYLVHRFRTAIEAYLVRIFIKAVRQMKSSDYKTHVFIGYADEDVGFVRHILLRYLEEDLKVSTFVHHRDLGPGYTDQQMFESMSDSWRILLVITQRFLNNYDLSDIIMKYASHSMSPANEKRLVLLVQETQLYNIPGYLYDVLEDSRIIVISDLSAHLSYVQRQAIKQCLRDIQ
ncbi:toll-like receptor 7 isoform X1 [Biomphalaria glabrata]|uniref:Toll-like receptor 7 isoform X1 n=2 Tax=Biomphalaria glabrata TaxID=6526 RepID=A0A9W3BB52_BIOGL|nr:toll-like receptor 7 isoform X1 [Biomphalaria glabrata]XP_055896666.1 toll-like receptor 7 isoform X1 [Biomphalaria glabrata]XP_055896667.1 toll-like receptor 7 isoform X1 [Biomphalaria glabrata]XP_055896668.1 toll-like receptor 7 isoform X1 [Biomphalaria glabrata]XP_055896669.1 toll-like receptor 7 isoform X1 [Biomphalaria glabrata]